MAHVKLSSSERPCLAVSMVDSSVEESAESQAVTRPSELVIAVKVGVEEEVVGERRVRVHFMFAAGLPATVSRTWQVIQGLGAAAIITSLVAFVGVEKTLQQWKKNGEFGEMCYRGLTVGDYSGCVFAFVKMQLELRLSWSWRAFGELRSHRSGVLLLHL